MTLSNGIRVWLVFEHLHQGHFFRYLCALFGHEVDNPAGVFFPHQVAEREEAFRGRHGPLEIDLSVPKNLF